MLYNQFQLFQLASFSIWQIHAFICYLKKKSETCVDVPMLLCYFLYYSNASCTIQHNNISHNSVTRFSVHVCTQIAHFESQWLITYLDSLIKLCGAIFSTSTGSSCCWVLLTICAVHLLFSSPWQSKPYFTSTFVVTAHDSNVCSVFVLQACLCATCSYGFTSCDLTDTKDADTDKALLSCDVNTKVLVKLSLGAPPHSIFFFLYLYVCLFLIEWNKLIWIRYCIVPVKLLQSKRKYLWKYSVYEAPIQSSIRI